MVLYYSFLLHLGGSDDQPSFTCPLFLGYFEESFFLGPHYQSVVPTRSGTVLDTIKELGGFNVCGHFGYSETRWTEVDRTANVTSCSGQLFLCSFSLILHY